MASVKYADCLDEVWSQLAVKPSDPEIDSTVQNAYRRTVIELCAGSWVWKESPDPLDVSAGESACDFELPQGAEVCAVLSVVLSGQPLDASTLSRLDQEIPDWRTRASTPRFYALTDTEQILLAPVPDASASGALVLTLALQPTPASTGFPRWLYRQYGDALADGAAARLMLMSGKPWSDLKNGAFRRDRFVAAAYNARARAASGLSGAPLRSTSQH